MKKKINLLVVFFSLFFPKAQVGINTTSPKSTLTVNGSMSTKYRLVTGSDTATDKDQYLDYKGPSDIIINLPAQNSFGGRIYEIRNGSTSNTITVQANGSETIENNTTSSSSILIPAGYIASIKSNGGTTGITWVLTSLGRSSIPVNQKALNYVTTTTSPINASTPMDSEACIGVICVRYAGTSPNSTQSTAKLQFKFNTQNNYSFTKWLFGSGFCCTSGVGGYSRGTIPGNMWVDLDTNGLTPANDDMTSYMISAITSQKLYRINSIISGDKTNPISPSVVKIFVEELE